jgi:YHS domain-containing protein
VDRVVERERPSGPVVCPVCARVFEPDQEAEHVEFASRTVWLCNERCRKEFDRQPLRYTE